MRCGIRLGLLLALRRAEEVDVDVEHLEKEGRLCWVCEVPPQAKDGLVAPVRSVVAGL
jgi:hypothetical protein